MEIVLDLFGYYQKCIRNFYDFLSVIIVLMRGYIFLLPYLVDKLKGITQICYSI